MAIPFVFEIAIGLFFIYLALSLLASEIQEIIGTLLQWRAEHLKRAIEILVSANSEAHRIEAQAFADRLYQTPLIRSLNQEASGPIAHFFRLINQSIGKIYRGITRARNVFGQETSGPSYIPSEAFAQALLESIQVEDLRNILLQGRLVRYLEEKLLLPLNHMINDLRASTANEFLLNAEFRDFEQSIRQLVVDFQESRVSLSETIDRLVMRLESFTGAAQMVLPDNHHLTETFMRRLHYLKQGIAASSLDKSALLKTLQPSLTELLTVLDNTSPVYGELKLLASREGSAAQQILARIEAQSLPETLKESLFSLAKKASTSIAAKASETVLSTAQDLAQEPIANMKILLSDLESDVSALKLEIENWFNRGMDRASGVYRRNAKAVSLIIGFAVAISLNADSLHILDRLSKDPIIRNAINQAAEEVAANNPEVTVNELQQQMDEALTGVSIPIGYGDEVVQAQKEAQDGWFIPLIPRRVIGWFITGFALSMGASFWFNLLKRVIDIKNTGRDEDRRSPG